MNFNPKIITDGLLVCLDAADKKSYSGSGDTWYDRSSNGHNGALENDPTFSTDAGGCLDFDGVDEYVSVPENSTFVTAQTWGLWFLVDSIPSASSYTSIFQHSDTWNSAGGISMQFIYGNFTWSWGRSWGGCCQISQSELSTGTWYHVVGTSDGTTDSDGCKLYMNGELKDTGTADQIPDDDDEITIGKGNGGTMNGRIANFSIYSKELSAAEITQNYNAMRGRFGI